MQSDSIIKYFLYSDLLVECILVYISHQIRKLPSGTMKTRSNTTSYLSIIEVFMRCKEGVCGPQLGSFCPLPRGQFSNAWGHFGFHNWEDKLLASSDQGQVC